MQGVYADAVVQADDAALDHPCRDATMATHGLEGATTEAFLQFCAGLAPTGGFQQCLADAKAPALEAEQVDAGNRDIAAQLAGRHGRTTTEQGGNDGQVFPLNQGHLSCIARSGAAVVAGQASFASGFHGFDFEHGFASFGTNADPAHPADLWYLGQQFL